MNMEEILNQAFRLGRDLEAHAAEQVSDPPNYAKVRRYVDVEMRRLKRQLHAIWLANLQRALCPDDSHNG